MKKRQKNLLIWGILILILICLILIFVFFSEKENALSKDKIYCSKESRNFDICATIYEPVCGYYLENCNDLTCKKTFSNFCFACMDKEVLFYINGKCQ